MQSLFWQQTNYIPQTKLLGHFYCFHSFFILVGHSLGCCSWISAVFLQGFKYSKYRKCKSALHVNYTYAELYLFSVNKGLNICAIFWTSIDSCHFTLFVNHLWSMHAHIQIVFYHTWKKLTGCRDTTPVVSEVCFFGLPCWWFHLLGDWGSIRARTTF